MKITVMEYRTLQFFLSFEGGVDPGKVEKLCTREKAKNQNKLPTSVSVLILSSEFFPAWIEYYFLADNISAKSYLSSSG